MESRTLSKLTRGALLAAALTGCSSHQMTVPGDVVSASEELPITDRSSWSGALADESFQMGPYAVKDVDRDWNSGSSWGVAGFSSDSMEGGYSFRFTADGVNLEGACATEATDKSFDLGSGMSVGNQTAKVACTCGDDASVLLQASTSESYGGTLRTSGSEYAIEAIYDRDGGLSDGNPSGYRVDGDGPAGAVDVLKPGRVWIGRHVQPPEREQLACIFAGLLLYMPPRD
jgi:hypothetical protein